jgi:hypothetical protein
MGKNQWVTPRQDGKWQVKGEGNSRATAVTNTQKEAKVIAKQIAQNQKSEVIIQGTNNKIVQLNSYGNDPFPPKG